MKIRPEADFLTYCCRHDASNDWIGLQRRASHVQSWDSVVRLSAQHGIAPLLLPLFRQLSEECGMPDRFLTHLRSVALSDVGWAVHLRSALREMLTVFQDVGVRVIVLKGAALACLLYEDPNVRTSRDIDLLCTEEDYGKVRDALVSLGYSTDAGPTLPPRHTCQESYPDSHFLHADRLVHVELHLDSIKVGVKPRHSDSTWNRASQIKIENAPALALGPEDQVLTLSVHLHRHGFNRLIWFKDIDLLVRRYRHQLDWKIILGQAKAEGVVSSLWYTFHLLGKMFDTPVPEHVMNELRLNPVIRWSLARIWPESRVLNLRSRTKRRAVQFSISESWRGIVPSLLLMGRKRDKMGILMRRLLPF